MAIYLACSDIYYSLKHNILFGAGFMRVIDGYTLLWRYFIHSPPNPLTDPLFLNCLVLHIFSMKF